MISHQQDQLLLMRFPLTSRGVLLLDKLQLCMLLSLEQEVWRLELLELNWHWRPKWVLLSQSALKWCSKLAIPNSMDGVSGRSQQQPQPDHHQRGRTETARNNTEQMKEVNNARITMELRSEVEAIALEMSEGVNNGTIKTEYKV